MKFEITDPHVGRLFLAVREQQQRGITPADLNGGLEKAQHDLRQMQAEALVATTDEVLPSANELRDLRNLHPDVPARNHVYLAIMMALGGLTPREALDTIERFLRLPFVVVEPNTPGSARN